MPREANVRPSRTGMATRSPPLSISVKGGRYRRLPRTQGICQFFGQDVLATSRYQDIIVVDHDQVALLEVAATSGSFERTFKIDDASRVLQVTVLWRRGLGV